MARSKHQVPIPLIVTDVESIDESQSPITVSLFNPDGTPFDLSGGGSGTPENLEEHIADPTPHMAAVSGLNLAQMYAAGRI